MNDDHTVGRILVTTMPRKNADATGPDVPVEEGMLPMASARLCLPALPLHHQFTAGRPASRPGRPTLPGCCLLARGGVLPARRAVTPVHCSAPTVDFGNCGLSGEN